MHLRRLEIQGFKTFASKTMLEFVPAADGRRGVTAVIGPNGSGKSNIADAIRWVMGEQSLKLLRSKKSEDVIFSGSAEKPRSGFAEVSLTLQNDDRPDIDFSEITVTRRLYRDGESGYEINKQAVRLTDVVLLLAQCGIGQRTYSVIGQGMVDAVLTAGPAERKEFFDEAAGVRPFQLKRHSAVNKLEASRANLHQAEVLLKEITPRLASLERQAKRLQERDGLEAELRSLERRYYGSSWLELRGALDRTRGNVTRLEHAFAGMAREAEKLESEFAGMEKGTPASEELRKLQASLDALRDERAKLRETQIRLESRREAQREVAAQKPWSPLPLSKIIEDIGALDALFDELMELVSAKQLDAKKIHAAASKLRTHNADLLGKLQRPAPEPKKANDNLNAELEAELTDVAERMSGLATRLAKAESDIREASKKEDDSRSHLFEMQRKISAKRHEAQLVERELTDARVELARIEARRDSVLNEIKTQAPFLESELEALADEAKNATEKVDGDASQRIHRLRTQLEWIGGIDPETVKEYETTKARHDELSTQTVDLQGACTSLETIIAELDQTIAERADKAFEALNREFGSYFKKLFGGGEAKLVKLQPEAPADGEAGDEDADEDGAPADRVAGIDILATPPGKRLKSIALLSGGERALTSIALICAIMAVNPSPFVVLDEVDAALDEANSRKFAEIIDGLSDQTQFVVVTHNRNTMHKANVLYGVTMGADGVSQLLSVNLEQVPQAH